MNKVIILLLFISSHANAIEVLRVSPSGKDVSYQKQISISFSAPMIELGNMDVDSKKLPIKIKPELPCHWHWVDQKNLNCELDDTIPNATEFKVTIKKTMKSYKNELLDRDYNFSFSTLRPRATYISPKSYQYWDSPAKPIVNINFNMPVLKKSVIKNVKLSGTKSLNIRPRSENGCSKDLCQYWELFVTNKLERNKEYLLTVGKGISSPGGKLKSNKVKFKKVATAPTFRIERISCYRKSGSRYGDDKVDYVLKHNQSNDFSKDKRCEPHKTKIVFFTLPVIPKNNYKNILIYPNPSGKSKVDPFSTLYDFSSEYPTKTLYLPKVLKSKRDYKFDLSQVTNIYGEKLHGAKDFSIGFTTRTPEVSTKYDDAIVESEIKNDIPILITNMKELKLKYKRWNTNGFDSYLEKTVKVPYVEDISFNFPLGLKELVSSQSGAVLYNFELSDNSYYSAKDMLGQLTPYQVFAKLGHFNSFVWVFNLADGKPIKNASISISMFGGQDKIGKSYKTDGDGRAKLPGIIDISPDLKIIDQWGGSKSTYYIHVKKDDNMAALPLSRKYYTASWDSPVYAYLQKKYSHIKVWGLTPQGVYKPGSDISYKLFVRNESNEKITMPPKGLKYNLSITDPTGKVFKQQKNIQLTEFGTYYGDVLTSKNVVTGMYKVFLTIVGADSSRKVYAFSFLISDFKPSPFKSLTSTDKSVYKKGEKIIVTGSARMHSGGPYAGNDSRITVILNSRRFQPKNKKYKTFDFTDDTYQRTNNTLSKTTEKLAKSGDRVVELELSSKNPYASLFIENAVRDDRGKYIASRTTAEYFGQTQFLGGKLDKWSYKVGDDVEINHVVLDTASKLVKNSLVNVEVFHETITASKVKSSGNAYITKYNREWKSVKKCKVKIKDDEENLCEFEPDSPGYYKVSSSIAGMANKWNESFYVVGSGQFLWGGDDNDSLTLVSEVDSVKIKDKVKILVKNPFPKAKAIITVERYGVIDQWVEEVDESAHIIEFKVKPNYLPGFYVSVNLFSHRADKSNGFGKLDLGKPSMKTGYIQFEVKDTYKEIKVEIETDKEKYLPGEEVELEFEAEARNGRLKDVELAIIVLDEAVFDLIKDGESYFDPYKGLFKLDNLDVQTFSLIKNLIGKQKFEKKGANQGGDGSSSPKVRSFIDYVAYWNPAVKTDGAEGKISFKLPDNLTGWKVLAIATDKFDKLGLSTERFVTNLPTEIRAALPNQVIEKDEFKARFTIMNRESVKRTLKVELQASGLALGAEKERNKVITLKLDAGERKYIEHSIKVGKIKESKDSKSSEVRFLVKAGDNIHQDIYTKQIKVNKERPSYFSAQYGKVLENKNEIIDIKFPENIYSDVGGIKVSGSTTLIGQLEDGFKYLKNYPYACWEQKLSKALGAAQFIKLNKYFDKKLDWDNADQLVKDTLKLATNFQLESGGMSYYGKYESPYLSAFTLNAFAWLESYGYKVSKQVKQKLISYNQKVILKNQVFNKYWNLGMRSSVRAASLAALSEYGVLKQVDLNRYWSKFNNMTKFGQFNYYQAAINIRSKKSSETLKQLLSSLVIDAGKARFNEKLVGNYGMFHQSNKRTQCMALLTTINALNKKINEKQIKDLPDKLLRSIILDMRTKTDYFNSTQSTLYCLNAMINYANKFESKTPDLKMAISIDKKTIGEESIKGFKTSSKDIRYDIKSEDIGKTKKLTINNSGTGTLYYKTLVSYSSKDEKTNFNNGLGLKKVISIKRDEKWIQVGPEFTLKRGELVRVDLFLSTPTMRHYVVIDDPIPGGFEPVNTELATASTIDASLNQYTNALKKKFGKNIISQGLSRYSFYHQELKHDRAIFYSSFLPAGNYHVAYTAQVIATGKFTSMPTIAKEMYAPETNGTTNRQVLNIVE